MVRLRLKPMPSDLKCRSLVIVLWKESLFWRKKKCLFVPRLSGKCLLNVWCVLLFTPFQSPGILHFICKGSLFSALSMGFVWFFPGVRRNQWRFEVSATIHSANSPTMADFKPSSWRHWPWSWEERCTFCSGKPVLADSSNGWNQYNSGFL